MGEICSSPFRGRLATQFLLGHPCSHEVGHSKSAKSPLPIPPDTRSHPLYPILQKMGVWLFLVPATISTNCHKTLLICSIDLWSESGIVAVFTLGNLIPCSHNWNERSKMVQNSLLLCGTAASGDILRFWCGASFMSSHLNISALPCATFSRASCHKQAAASGNVAEMCGLQFTAASKCSLDHDLPQSTGQPYIAYSNKNGYAGWC